MFPTRKKKFSLIMISLFVTSAHICPLTTTQKVIIQICEVQNIKQHHNNYLWKFQQVWSNIYPDILCRVKSKSPNCKIRENPVQKLKSITGYVITRQFTSTLLVEPGIIYKKLPEPVAYVTPSFSFALSPFFFFLPRINFLLFFVVARSL